MKNSKISSLLIPILSFVLAIIMSAIIMALCGYNPITAYRLIFKGAFGNFRRISNTLIQATPLIFTGLAYMVAKKTTMINLGVEGQLYVGAMAAAIVGIIPVSIPMPLHIFLCALAGFVAGGLSGLFIGYLKVRFGSQEVITTSMMNFILINFCNYLVNYPLKAEGGTPQTDRIADSAVMPKIIGGYQLTYAIVFAFIVGIVVYILMEKTKLGFEIQCVGLNQKASETAGIKVSKVIMTAMLISGGVAGLGGAAHVMAVDHRFIANFSPGYGYSGIAVTALANESAIGVIISGIVFGALKTGADYLNMSSRIPTEFVSIVQAFVVILISAPLLVKDIVPILKEKKANKKKAVAKEESK